VLDSIEALAADAAAGLPFDALRAVRTDLGRRIGSGPTAAGAPSSDTAVYLRRLYASLTEDMSAAARGAGPDASRALALADRYTRINRNLNTPVLERILAQGTDEQVFRMVFPASGRPDAQTLARVRRNMQPDEWQAVAATVLDRMGMPTPGSAAAETFSPATFLTNLNRLHANGPGAFDVLFRGPGTAELATQLQRLGRVAGYIRDAGRLANTSGTARVAFGLGSAGAAGNEIMEGDMAGLAKVVGLTVVAPNVAARLLTNPRFVSWLATTAPVTARSGAVGEPAWKALVRTSGTDPELRSDVEALRSAVTGAR
jgi:hypothetical protein